MCQNLDLNLEVVLFIDSQFGFGIGFLAGQFLTSVSFLSDEDLRLTIDKLILTET